MHSVSHTTITPILVAVTGRRTGVAAVYHVRSQRKVWVLLAHEHTAHTNTHTLKRMTDISSSAHATDI